MKWRIIQSDKIKKDIFELCTQAHEAGRGRALLGSLRRVLQRLRDDPSSLGEPHNRLKHLDLLLCVVVEPPIVVRFAVDEKHYCVYIRSVELL
jgi:hypothetical protein